MAADGDQDTNCSDGEAGHSRGQAESSAGDSAAAAARSVQPLRVCPLRLHWCVFLFQAVDSSIAAEEKTLQHIESMAEAVRSNTSPAGAEVVLEEAEELRLGWQRLRQGLCEAEEGLRSSLDSHSQYVSRCQQLVEDISRLRALMQRLDGELVQSSEAGGSTDPVEEQLVAQWNKYMVGYPGWAGAWQQLLEWVLVGARVANTPTLGSLVISGDWNGGAQRV